MGALDDYFGQVMIGYDPYADQRSARLERLSAIDSMMTGGSSSTGSKTSAQPGDTGTSVGTTQPQQPQFLGANVPNINDITRYLMTLGGGTDPMSKNNPA